MIIVAGTTTLDPLRRAALLGALEEIRAPSMAEEDCVEYEFWVSHIRPDVIFVFERWASTSALEAHLQTPHIATLRPVMKASGITAFRMTKYDVLNEVALR
jgi:quinol monooxygenase YgiN